MKIKKILLILFVIIFCVINKSNCQVSAVQLHYPENIKIDQANGNLHIYAPAGLENQTVCIDVEMDSGDVDFLQITLTSAVILDRVAIYTCRQEKINGNYKYFYPNQAAIYFFPFSENEKSFILEMKVAEGEVLARFDVNLKIDIRDKDKQDWENLMLVEEIIDNQNNPIKFTLEQNYPNPFHNKTTIEYTVHTAPIFISIEIIKPSQAGLVRSYNNLYCPKTGKYNLIWDKKDNEGKFVPSGVYCYRLIVDGVIVAENRMIIMQ